MTEVLTPGTATRSAGGAVPSYGVLGRLGVWTAGHVRVVLAVWALVAVALGAFAPKVEPALAGAGWEASGSQSVQVRTVVQREFGGLSSAALQVVVHSVDGPVTSGAGGQVIAKAVALLRGDSRVSQVVPPQPGISISRDGRTAVVQAARHGYDASCPTSASATDRRSPRCAEQRPARPAAWRAGPGAASTSNRPFEESHAPNAAPGTPPHLGRPCGHACAGDRDAHRWMSTRRCPVQAPVHQRLSKV